MTLVHIGYHKTGTTWLQLGLFSSDVLRQPMPRKEINREFVWADQFSFDPTSVAIRVEAASKAVADTGAQPVLSHERLSGSPHGGGYDSRAIADRLKSTIPDARILIVIREQRQMFGSLYKQYVGRGGPMTVAQYAHPPKSGGLRIPLFRWEFLEFERLIEYYQRLFSPGAVLVLPYEQLRVDPVRFVEMIVSHAGAGSAPASASALERLNPGASTLGTLVRRPLNRFVIRDGLNPAGWIEREKTRLEFMRITEKFGRMPPASIGRWLDGRFTAKVNGLVGDRYAASNARTEQLTGLDLRAWGYPVSSPA